MTAIGLAAESMTLDSGYVIKARNFADGNQLIHLTEPTGEATAAFSGAAGTYDVVLKHYDESDGQGTIKVTIGNNEETITLDQNPGGRRPSAINQVNTLIFEGLQINPNDPIKITASMDGGEVVAIDGFEFLPVVLDTTPPTATLTASDFDIILNGTNAHTFTVQFEDNEGVDLTNLNTAITVENESGESQDIEFVEVDNNTNGSPRVATYSLKAPGGSWDTNEAGTYTVIATDTLTDINGNALTAGSLGTFDVNVQSNPTGLEIIKVEAEDLTLGGNYQVETGYDTNIVSDGKLISIQNVAPGTGTADYTFTGDSGLYDVVVTYFDENDGQGSLTANLNGQSLDSWTFGFNFTGQGTDKVAAANRVQRTIEDVTINPGNVFSLSGQRQAGESTRVDFIEFRPAVDSDPIIDDDTIDYRFSDRRILGRLDEEFGLQLKYDRRIKLMPLGDSITAGKEDNTQDRDDDWIGYRGFLQEDLAAIGLEVDFVGSQQNGPAEFDRDNEGRPGWSIRQLVDGRTRNGVYSPGLDTWIPPTDPDIVLLKIGTNDIGSRNVNRMADNLGNYLIPAIYDRLSPDSHLIVSNIAPVSQTRGSFDDDMEIIEAYNSEIPGIVNQYKATGRNISFVDIWEGSNGIEPEDISVSNQFIEGGERLDNGLHPTEDGYRKIADFYYDAVLDAAGTKKTFNDIDNIVGSNFDDKIVGNNEDNEITGGGGSDELTGDDGADKFIYTKPEDGGDTLTDFDPSEGDVFWISADGFGGGLTAGVDLSNETASSTGVLVTNSNPQAIGNSANFLYNTNTGVLRVDIDGVGSQSPVLLATLENEPTLGIDQFEIV